MTTKDPRRVPDIVPTAADISEGLSSRWRRSPKSTGVPPTFVSTAADVLGLNEDVTTVIANKSPEELTVALWELGHELGCVRLDKGAIDSFAVRIGGRTVRVGWAIESAAAADQRVSEALTSRSQVVGKGTGSKRPKFCVPPST